MEDVMEEPCWPMEEANSIKPMRKSRTASSKHYSISQELRILFLMEMHTCQSYTENIFSTNIKVNILTSWNLFYY